MMTLDVDAHVEEVGRNESFHEPVDRLSPSADLLAAPPPIDTREPSLKGNYIAVTDCGLH